MSPPRLALLIAGGLAASAGSANAQYYGSHYGGYGYGYGGHVDLVPHTQTHIDLVPHGDHLDAVPHTTTHYDAVPHYGSHYGRSRYSGYSTYYGLSGRRSYGYAAPNYGGTYYGSPYGGHIGTPILGGGYHGSHYGGSLVPHTTTHLDAVPHNGHVDLVPHTTTHFDYVPH